MPCLRVLLHCSAGLKDPFTSFRIIARASRAYLAIESNRLLLEQQEAYHEPHFQDFAAAIVVSTAGAANAQAFSSGWGTGNVQTSHYNDAGKLTMDNTQQNSVVRVDRANDGLSAFASAPAGEASVTTVPGGSVGYNELLATH